MAAILLRPQCVNSVAPGKPGWHLKTAIFNLILLIGIFTSSKDNALRWMPRDLTDDKLTLVQVMAWCCQATSHYLSQCWPSSMSPYGVTRPQWVKPSKPVVHTCITFQYSWQYEQIPIYCQISNISRIKSPNLHISHLILQLSLPDLLKPGAQARMKM